MAPSDSSVHKLDDFAVLSCLSLNQFSQGTKLRVKFHVEVMIDHQLVLNESDFF